MKPISLFIIVFILSSSFVFSEEKNPIQLYQEIALSKKLDLNRYWRLLLHYRDPIFFGKSKSEADGNEFFLSPNGKTDPKAELLETISSFFREPLPEEIEETKLHPFCKYPERFRWLDSQLNFDRGLLPKLNCERYKNWIEALNPTSIKLIFASFYLNNPASLFGHNLLKIGSGESSKSEIL
ncbi:DUF7843 domain-containing protein, partial [Leptospira interrogans]